MEPIWVTRSVVLPTTSQEAWAHLVDEELLSDWIGAEVRPEGGSGLADVGAAVSLRAPGGDERRAVVTGSEPGHRLAWVWWDQEAPGEASVVEMVLEPAPQGVRLTVVETVPPAAASSKPCTLAAAEVDQRWSGRFGMLAERLLQASPSAAVL